MSIQKKHPWFRLALVLGAAAFLSAPSARRDESTAVAFALEIDGTRVGFTKSFEGGFAVQPATLHGTRADGYPDKVPGTVHYQDAVVELSLPLPTSIWDWINAASSPATPQTKAVTIVTLDSTLKERNRRNLDAAALTRIELSTLDAASNQFVAVKLNLSPSAVHDGVKPPATATANSAAKATATATGGTRRDPIAAFAFRVTVDGVSTALVSRVDPIVISHPQAGLSYANIGFTVTDSELDSWRTWQSGASASKTLALKSAESKGAATSKTAEIKSGEKHGKIELLSTSMDVLLTIDLDGLGLVSIAPIKVESSDPLARSRVELYVEKISFSAVAQ
jgi:hypothetical protein